MSDRLTRVNELLKREIASYLYRVMNQEGFDLSSVTVTHVIVSSNLRQARVLVSIRDHQHDRGSMLRMLRESRQAINQHLRRTVKLKYVPALNFEFDDSLSSGDHVLDILDRLEHENPSLEHDDDTESDA